MKTTLLFVWFIILVIIFNECQGEQPLSVCQNDKPFKTMDNSCSNFKEICVKKDDPECDNFQTACSQCPPTNFSIITYHTILNFRKDQLEKLQKISQINEEFQKFTQKTDKNFVVLYIILSITILLFVILFVVINFKLITKSLQTGTYQKSRKYFRIKGQINEESQKFTQKTGSLTDSSLAELVEQIKNSMEPVLNVKLEELAKFVKRTLVRTKSTMKFQIKEVEKLIELNVHMDDNIVKIKRKILKKLLDPKLDDYKIMQLKYNGNILNENKYLLSCVDSNAIVECEINHQINANDIVILKLICNQHVPKLIQMNKIQRISDLKKNIFEINYSKELAIFKDSIQLNDEDTLYKSNLNDGDWIKVIIKKQGELVMKSIFEERESLVVEFLNLDLVSTLKTNAANKFQCLADNFALFLHNQYLDEKKYLYEYDIDKTSSVKFCYLMKLDDVEILNEIGKGYYSTLLKAKIRSKTKEFILKKYTDISLINLKDNKSMLKELTSFQITKSHTRFVQLFGIYKDDNYFYIAMENMAEGSIKEYQKKNGKPLQETEIVRWSKQIMEGLKYLHERKITYRDLKTSNILIDEKKNVKLPSLSLSKYLYDYERNPSDNEKIPLRYLAPEILKKKSYGIQADIWSFGAILIEMVTSEPPYFGMDEKLASEAILKNQTIKYDFPENKMSNELKIFIESCLKWEPDDRATDDQLLADKLLLKIN